MTSGTPLLTAAGASPTTSADDPATSSRLNAVLNSQETPRLVCSSSQRVTPYLNSASAPISCNSDQEGGDRRQDTRSAQVGRG